MDVNFLLGVLGLAVAIASLGYARRTFKKDYEEKPNEEMQHLLVQFKATQTLSRQTYAKLHALAEEKDYFDEFIFPNITYRRYLDEMLKSQEDNLSDKLYDQLLAVKLTSPTIQSMTKSLEVQFQNLTAIYNEANMRL